MKAREMNTLVSKATYKMKLERSSQAVTKKFTITWWVHSAIQTLNRGGEK